MSLFLPWECTVGIFSRYLCVESWRVCVSVGIVFTSLFRVYLSALGGGSRGEVGA